MKWNLTVFIVAAVAVVSYGLYQLSYEVQKLESDLRKLKAGIEDNREAVRVLKAEWAYENRPEKLQALAAEYLPLLLVAPYQVAEVDELPARANPFTLQARAIPVPRKKPRSRPSRSAPASGPLQMATFGGRQQRNGSVK